MRPFAPIAIVGRACLLPGCDSPEALWAHVLSGDDMLGASPEGRWRADPRAVMADQLGREGWVDRAGYVTGFEARFDPTGFALDADEVAALPTLTQWVLHCGREALAQSAPGGRAGAVLGNLSLPTDGLARWMEAEALAGSPLAVSAPPADARFMSGRPAHDLARALGLGEGAFAVDAACASALYAVKLACDALHDGRADVMLAGAVNAADQLFLHIGFAALQALSASGRSRPFHAEADGLVPTEGCAFVALKRLEDAEAAGDRIYGVIRGIGLSNDGRGQGLLVPAADAQVRAMREAYAQAGLAPSDVAYVECHATGTAVGDATELDSLAAVFDDAGAPVAIGSLKATFGHPITVAGLAGLIKVLGAFEAGVLPPTPLAGPPNGAIAHAPVRLVTAPEPWVGPQRAAISAFGFGGNNAHLIVEAHGLTPAAPAPRLEEGPIAVVGLGVVAAGATGRGAFADALRDGRSYLAPGASGPLEAAAGPITLPFKGMRFPPHDMESSLPQQLALLAAATEATRDVAPAPGRERTLVIAGMQTDATIARYGLRARLRDLAGPTASAGWVEAARAAVAPPLTAAAVLGRLPNVVANRLNAHFDWAGPSYALAGEARSGLDAIALARRALLAGEADMAVVGAVDMAAEPAHALAARSLGGGPAGDAAVVLVLKRLADARGAGDDVLAVLEPPSAAPAESLAYDPTTFAPQFGDAHAASGMVAIAAGVAALAGRMVPGAGAGAPARPWLSTGTTRHVEVSARVRGGLRAAVTLSAADPIPARSPAATPTLTVFSGADAAGLLAALDAGRESDVGPARLVVAARPHEREERLAIARQVLRGERATGPGVTVRLAPLDGEVASVFGGAASAYAGMGAGLLLAAPALVEAVTGRSARIAASAGWAYGPEAPEAPTPSQKLWGASFLCQAHAELSRRLGLPVRAAIGLSSGETNALCAYGAWRDMDDLHDAFEGSGAFARHLGGDTRVLQEAWGLDAPRWVAWRVLADAEPLEAALAATPHVARLMTLSPGDHVIGGEAEAVAAVLAVLGASASPLGYDVVVHSDALAPFAAAWRRIHHRETFPVPGVRFYTHATHAAYAPSADACADALTAQALAPLDFPALIERAYDDGVRVFVEHGPQGALSAHIKRVLGDRPHLAVAFDGRHEDGLDAAFSAVAQLVAAGVPLDRAALDSLIGAPPMPDKTGPALVVAAHAPAIALPPLEASAPAGLPVSAPTPVTRMAPAPALPSVSASAAIAPAPAPAPTPVAAAPRAIAPAPAPAGEGFAPMVVEAHEAFLAAMRRQRVVHEAYLAAASLGSPPGYPASATTAAPSAPVAPQPPAPASPSEGRVEEVPTSRALRVPATPGVIAPVAPLPPRPPVASPTPSPGTTSDAAPEPRGPRFDRAQLEVLASGRVSDVFGELFVQQDAFARQVRMPMPPLLLADRVTGIDAAPGVLGRGTIWTETDVRADDWYVHDGHMPPGVMIEAGQADLLLASWMGADFLNRGERVYRLLGCELTYHGALPQIGDTLRFDIHIDQHARQGDIRLFFFHYDCRVDGAVRLSVRNGQAGFFTDAELADSGGVLWSPEAEAPAPARLDAPRVPSVGRSFGLDRVRAFSEGRVRDCFGDTHAIAETHTLSPRIQPGPMMLLGEVTDLDPTGGPWGRGYMRAVRRIAPDDWFFAGHFKNDPCMPGTLIFEGGMQAMAFYLAALGHTLDKDGWRFEPVPDLAYSLRCRGQVQPTTRELVVEIFVTELHDGPSPTLYADILATVDGLKAFHCRRMGYRLVPDFPLSRMPHLLDGHVEPVAVAEAPGIRFGYASLLACAWGRPSDAFGPTFAPLDNGRRGPRLPGHPYHFMSRVTAIDGTLGDPRVGSALTCEYDVPPDAWYFGAGCGEMPFCVLLEAALQPCGWLSSFIGTPLTSPDDMFFRNLDGKGTVHDAVRPGDGVLTTRATLRSLSRAGGMVIVAYAIECHVGDRPIYSLDTVFGFFPAAALATQAGLPPEPADLAWLEKPSDVAFALPRAGAGPVLADAPLLMLDRVTGHWPDAGQAGLGRLRAEKDVSPSEWFFKAHFFQDPVQPGSLGIEAMLQAIQVDMQLHGLGAGMAAPRFVPIDTGARHAWKYRGQVLPHHGRVTVEIEVTARDATTTTADAWLWVDGMRIYEARGLAMRVVEGATPPEPPTDTSVREETFDPAVDAWIGDHCPTHVIPALPMTVVLDRLAAAAAELGGGRVVTGLRDVTVSRWLALPDGPLRTRAEARLSAGGAEATLSVWREAGQPALSRFEAAAGGHVELAEAYPSAPAPWAPLDGARPQADPYTSGMLFHGPAFQVLSGWALSSEGGEATLDARPGAVPVGRLHPVLLDGVLQAIPHDALDAWFGPEFEGLISFPSTLDAARFYGPPPVDGAVRGQARLVGRVPGAPLVRFALQIAGRDGVWAELDLTFALLPKGAIGRGEPDGRRRFLKGEAVAGFAIARLAPGETRCSAAEAREIDWLPGTIARVYGLAPGEGERAIAIKDHVAARLDVHPSRVRPVEGGAAIDGWPLTAVPLHVVTDGPDTVVRDAGAPALRLDACDHAWRGILGLEGPWLGERVLGALLRAFVERLTLDDPADFAALVGRPALYVANHQVGVESLLFSAALSGLTGVPLATLAKAEHRDSWLGRLIGALFQAPGTRDPGLMVLFDRDDAASLLDILAAMRADIAAGRRSFMAHVQGTRARSAGEPVTTVSGTLLDMALTLGLPIVPVGFVGGLPEAPVGDRLEFPVGHGRQVYRVGRAIAPAALAALPLAARKRAVLDAINGLTHPAPAPWPGQPGLSEAVERLRAERGWGTVAATLHAVLAAEAAAAPDPALAWLLDGPDAPTPPPGPAERAEWLRTLRAALHPAE